MKYNKVILDKEGLFGESWSKKLEDNVISGIRKSGKKGEFFWRNRDVDISIEGTVTLLDLIKTMSKMNADELHALSTIANANIANYLIDFVDHPDKIDDDDRFGKLKFIEVYKNLEFSNYESAGDVFDMSIYSHCHGIGEIWEETQKDVAEGRCTPEDAARCNAYAIEFTSWQKMLDLPIKIRKEICYCESIWKKCKPKKLEFGRTGSKKKFSLGTTDREHVKFDSSKKINCTMTMSEFFTGLFDELCFFETPKKRNKNHNDLMGRVKDVEKSLKKSKK